MATRRPVALRPPQGKKPSPGFAGSWTNSVAGGTPSPLGATLGGYSADLGNAVEATKGNPPIGFLKSGVKPDANPLKLAPTTSTPIPPSDDGESETIRRDPPCLPAPEMAIEAGIYGGMDRDGTLQHASIGGFLGQELAAVAGRTGREDELDSRVAQPSSFPRTGCTSAVMPTKASFHAFWTPAYSGMTARRSTPSRASCSGEHNDYLSGEILGTEKEETERLRGGGVFA